MSNIDNLNFAVILNDEDFNTKVNKDIELAKHLNTSLSSLLDIKSKIPQKMKVSIDTKDSEVSLEKLNAYFAELEKADWSKIGQKLDVTPQVNQALIQLKKLQEEIDAIQELRQESGGDMALALELRNAQEEANRLIATIAELRKVEGAVNAPSQFRSFVQSLTEQTMEQKQLIEYYKTEEAASKKVAEEKVKEEKARKKNAEAMEKERKAQSKGEFKEYIQNLTKANPELQAMSKYYKELEKETTRNAEAAKGAAIHQQTYNKQLEATSRLGREIKGALAGVFSIYGARAFLSTLIRITGEFELERASLGAMLGDLNKAEAVISKIKGLAVDSPFRFNELTRYAKQLSAFSVPAEELYETTKMLADVSAGLGVGMDRMVLAYGQVRSAAFLRGQEVRQFTEAGIPILDMLAKKFQQIEGTLVSAGEVFDRISAREVPFEMVAEIFKDMTSEGGEFFNMQEVQAETLKGKWENLKDAYEMMVAEMGEKSSGALKGGIDAVRNLLNNWEKVAEAIKGLIVLFGVYKTAIGLVKLDSIILQYGSLSKAIRATMVAQSGLNAAALVNPYAAMAVALGAVVLALTRASREANKFRKELEGISESALSEATKSMDRFDDLVEDLKNATEGSEDYRNAISKLNNEYGDYLPNLLTEKDALDEIEKSSDAVTRAIYRRAKAQAYEKGQEKIEATYGEDREYYASEFMSKLVDEGIAREDARRLFKAFNDEIQKQEDVWNPAELFNKVYSEYFNTDKKYFTDFGSFLNDVKQATPFMRNIYSENTTGWMTARDALWNYSLVLNEVNEAEEKNADIVESKFARTTYSPEQEKAELEEITQRYAKLREEQAGVNQSREEYNEAIRKLDIARLNEEIEAYQKFGRTEIVKELQKQLEDLQATAEGWRKTVVDVLTSFGLTQKTAGGLWPSKDTGTLEYGKNLIEQQKELKDGLHYITEQDKELTNSYLEKEKIVNAIIKALGVTKPPRGGSKKESKEEKRLKRLIESLRTLQKEYEDLKKLGASDESIKSLFRGMYPDLIKENGDEFVTDLKYLERAIKLAEQLGKKNPEAARKALMSLGADAVSQYKDSLKELNETYKKSAKVANEFFETMRKWKTEDFNIGGSGVLFDLRKLVSELNTTNNQIDLKAKKLKENLAKVIPSDLGNKIFSSFREGDLEEYFFTDEFKNLGAFEILPEITKRFGKDYAVEIANKSIDGFDIIKKTFIEEFGAETWDEFFNSLVTEGGSAIDKLVAKNKEFEQKVAQNKIDDLAKKHVSELTEGLNLEDWGDKSLKQIIDIRDALANLMNGYSIKDSATIEAINKAGLSLEQFEKIVDSLLGKKFGEAVDEQMKSAQKAAQSFAGILGDIGGAFSSLGDATDNEVLGGIGEVLNVTEEVAVAILECEAIWNSVGDAAKVAADTTSEVTESTSGLMSSLSIITMIVKLVVIAVEQIAKAIGASQQAQRELNMAALEYAKIINEKNLDLADTIFGENFRSKLKTNFKAVEDALNNLKEKVADFSTDKVTEYVNINSLRRLEGLNELATKYGFDLENEEDFIKFLQYLKEHRTEIENATQKDDGYKTTNKLKKDIDQILEYYEQYEEANKALKDSLQSIFGSLADDIATNMIDAFKRTGDAAADLETVFQNLGETLLKSMVSTWVLDNILQKYEKEATKILGGMALGADEFAIGKELEAMVNNIKADLENGADFINALSDAFLNAGLLNAGESAQTLADGIKGITEDTANLLASYLNAIRADVSYARVIWERLDVTTQQIAATLSNFSAPNFMEYQMQIAANTYNTAMHTEQIMRDLGSVLTSEGGPTAVRVLS